MKGHQQTNYHSGKDFHIAPINHTTVSMSGIYRAFVDPRQKPRPHLASLSLPLVTMLSGQSPPQLAMCSAAKEMRRRTPGMMSNAAEPPDDVDPRE